MSGEYRDPAGIVRLVWPDWEAAEKLGSGAFATVVRASRRNKIPGEKDSAIKIIRIPAGDGDWGQLIAEGKRPEQVEEYFRSIVEDALKEIRAMEELNGNTNIVSIFDYKVHHIPEEHTWYILIRMEYLQKVDPSDLDEEKIIRLGTDVCTALGLCRKKNIVHRDVSLDNIFVHDDNYKLGDFGVAKVLEGVAVTMHSLAGKPLYMAPEIYNAALSDTDIDSAARVDIYSLGILLYRLSNHMRYPFEQPEGENVTAKERNQAFRRRVIEGETLPPPDQASPGLARVILKACDADPDRRYRSAEAMKADLVSLAEAPEPAPPAPACRKKKILPVAIAAIAAAVLIAAAFLFRLPAGSPGPGSGTDREAPTDPPRESVSLPVLGVSGELGVLEETDEWSAWSDWYEKPPEEKEASPDRQEEIRERHEWKAVKCTYCRTNNPGGAATCSHCGESLSRAPYVYAYSEDSLAQVVDYRPTREFNGEQYWYSRPITEYRYRTKASAGATPEPQSSDSGGDILLP